MISVVNKKTFSGQGEYVGRPSVLGNPFTHLKGKTLASYVVETRELAIEKYREWLRLAWKDGSDAKKELLRLVALAKAGDLTLVCHCKPLACHGDVLKSVIETLISKGY